MRYSILLTMLLTVSSLFGADKVLIVDTTVVEQTNAELAAVRAEALKAKEEAQIATIQANEAREESQKTMDKLAQVKAQREEELATMAAQEEILRQNKSMHVSVIGQGVAPMNTSSPAQLMHLQKELQSLMHIEQ